MKKVVVAVDSFKGCLASLEIADAAERGIRKVFPDCEVVKLPVADGGEGTVDALVTATNGQFRTITANDPLMRPVGARYGILGDGQTAVIEMATASGLPLVPVARRNPMLTTTLGTGELIADALKNGCKKFVLGIGGSATNDGGAGMLQALGWKFFDDAGNELGQGGQILEKIARIDGGGCLPALEGAEFRVACDVDNPFSGPRGAAFVYAPQKGADAEMVKRLDGGLSHFAKVIGRQLGKDIDKLPGAGAAGGMGGALSAFLNAKLEPGIRLVLETVRFDELLAGADLVVTGEGKMDAQTAMGKAPQGIAAAAACRGVPVIAIAGGIDDADAINAIGIDGVFSIAPGPMSLEAAMERQAAAANVSRLLTQIFRTLQAFDKPPQ